MGVRSWRANVVEPEPRCCNAQVDSAGAASAIDELEQDLGGEDGGGGDGGCGGDLSGDGGGSGHGHGGGGSREPSPPPAPPGPPAGHDEPPLPPPPLPPPPAPPSEFSERRSLDGAAGRGRADVLCRFAGGEIVWYKHRRFEAVCRVCPKTPSGKPCKLSKVSYEGANKAQGRPLGLLAAWLEAGHQCMTDGADHKDKLFVKHCFPPKKRREARRRLREFGGAAAAALEGKEREQRLGEESEPEPTP